MPVAKSTAVSAFEPLRLYEPPPPEKSPTYWDIGRAAIEQENDIYAIYKMNQEKAYPMQPGFDLVKAAKDRGVEAKDYTEVLSEAELDSRIAKRRREEDNKQILESAGWTGYLAMMGAGMISPTTFIPFIRGATGVKSIALGAASIVSGAAAQEAMLYASQETRTKGEIGFSLAASTVIGGLLGAAAHTMSKSVIDKIAHDMVHSPKEPTIHEPMPIGGEDLSAKANDSILKDAGKLKRGWGADKLAFMSPITRGFQQWNAPSYIKELGGSTELRKITAGFSQAGLSLEGNAKFKAAVAGGNVEDLKRSYGVVSYLGRKLVDDGYIEYILGSGAKGLAKKQRAILQGVRADGKLNYNEFKRQITLDIWSNFTRDGVDPHVRKAAKAIDEKVYKKMYDEGVEVGLFTGKEKTVGDENYANRVYNNEVIMRRHEEFVKILAKNLSGKYQDDFAKEFEKLRERMLKDKSTLEDINRPLEEVLALREKIKQDAQQLEQQTSLDVLEGMDSLKGIKNETRALTKELEDLKATKIDGADVEGLRRRMDRIGEIEAALKSKALQSEGVKKALGEGLENYTKQLGEVRRRLANLSQASALKDQRLARKYEKIERNEDQQIATILRAQKQLQKFLKMLDSVSDDKLDETLSKWKTEFEKNSQQLTKLEEKRFEYEKLSEVDPSGPDNNNNPPPPPKDIPPAPTAPTDTPPVTPPTETPPAPPITAPPTPPSPAEVKAKVDAENKLVQDMKEQLVKDKDPELQGLSHQDLIDSLAPGSFIDDIKANPKKFAHVIERLKKGFIFVGGLFRQATKEDLDEAQALFEKLSLAYDGREQEIIKTFAGKAPSTIIDGTTFDDAMLKLDLEMERATDRLHSINRSYAKAKMFPEVQIPVPPPKPVKTAPPKIQKVKVENPEQTKLHPDFKTAIFSWTTADDAVDWFIKHGTGDYHLIAQRLKGNIENASFHVVNKDSPSVDLRMEYEYMRSRNWGGMYRNTWTKDDRANPYSSLFIRSDTNLNETTVLHELIHGAINTKISIGNKIENANTPLGKLVKELGEVHKVAIKAVEQEATLNGGNLPYSLSKVKYSVGSIYELSTVMLTEKFVADYFRNVPYKGKTLYSEFVRLLREILGIPKEEENVFTAVMDITDRIMSEPHPGVSTPAKYGTEEAQVIDEELTGQVAQAEENFKAWFGESKVVDNEGKPLVVYHGTSKDADFNKFKIGKRGAFFTTDRVSAGEYAITNDSQKLVMGSGWKFEQKNSASRVMPVYLSVQRPYKLSPAELDAYATDPRGYVKAQQEIADRAKAQGYDGVDYGGGVWVVFEPTQIKSAISNSGAYSKKTAHISGAPNDDPVMKLEDRMEKVIGKLDGLAEKIDNLENFDRDAFRAEVKDLMWELADTHAKINAKRAVRNEKLWKDVEKLSPEARQKKIDAFKLKAADRPKEFTGRWNTKAKGDLLKGEANFDDYAEEIARQTVKKILGSERRLAYSDIIQAERGPELARTLDIPSEHIADFLETDIEKLISIYTRTVGSDLAIARVFGSADAAEAFQKLSDERQLMLKKIETLTGKDGKPLSKEEQEQLQYDTHKFYDAGKKDLEVLLERAKSSRGLPRDADSASARMAKVAMDLNYLRFMGGVVVNSVADLARPIMKYGLTRTFRDGIIPMIRAFKLIRMSQREARLAGTALDMVMHTRAHSMMDIFDDAYRGTMAEKGIHFLSTRMGAIALFDQWTVAMKEFTAGIANAKLLDAIAIVNGEPASAKEIAKAQEFLARNNIDAEIATTIWGEVTNGKGGGKVNGVWLPNTENWNIADPQVARAQRAYRAALGSEVDSTIITPGFERPNWVDSSIPARLLAQFKSFGLSSVQKTIMAGLQEHDAAALNGVVASLGLGMLSYYLWATAAGGDAQEKMQRSIAEGDWGVWADEAIARSGITGVFADAQKYAHRVPVLRDYTSFSGGDTTRRAGGDLTETVLGPSFDLLEKAHGLITGIDEPTKQTLHTARQLLPFQNIFYLRQLLDQVEKSIDLPEKRAQ